MTIVEFLLLLLIAACAGSIGQSLAGFYLGGCLVSAFVGFIGAILGYWLARELGLPEFLTINVGGRPYPFIWAVLGSTLFSIAVGLLTRNRRQRGTRS